MAHLNSTTVTGNLSTTGNIIASTIIKNGGTNNELLLAGGNTKFISEFATAADLSATNVTVDNKLDKTGGTLNNKTSDTPLYLQAGLSENQGTYIGFKKGSDSSALGYYGFINAGTPVVHTKNANNAWSDKEILHASNYTNFLGNYVTHNNNKVNLISSNNEFVFIPDNYSGAIYINYRTYSGGTAGGVTAYHFNTGNGKTDGYADVYGKTFYGSLSGNASSATIASAVAWSDVTGKPTTFTPSTHSHSYINYSDTRESNQTPNDLQVGLTIHLKKNGTDGINDGKTYHPVVAIKSCGDYTGGPYAQLTMTAGQNMYFRTSKSGTAWNNWKKVLDETNYTNYAPTLQGAGATGTWGISIVGNAGTATVAGKISDITSSDAASSTDTWRHLWFSYDNNTTGRPAYDDRFAIQTKSGTLKTPNLKLQPTSGSEGGQIHLSHVKDKTDQNGIYLDTANGQFRVFGDPTKSGNTEAHGSILSYDPYLLELSFQSRANGAGTFRYNTSDRCIDVIFN